MNLDGLRDTVRDWQGESDAGARAVHLTTIRALLTRAPVITDPLDAALASVDPDAPDLVNTLRAAIEPVRATARAVAEIHDPLPDPLLSLAGKGALLSIGEVCMLSGEGGIAKSALAVGLAVDVANAADGAVSGAGPLRWHGGPASTLLVCYEDHAAHVAWRARRYAKLQARGGLDRVAVLSLDAPMYGPAESLTGGAALYNARPQPLAGWYDVAAAARETGARLIVIDPAGEAFAGEHNNVSAVREFLRALRGLAAAHAAGVIIIGHSNKAARKKEKHPDLFDSGLVSGSAAWHDGVRGVLSLQWRIGGASGARDLVCPKSNHGPARMVCGLDAIRDQEPDGAIIGFEASAGVGWHAPRKGDSDERPRRASGVAETVA